MHLRLSEDLLRQLAAAYAERSVGGKHVSSEEACAGLLKLDLGGEKPVSGLELFCQLSGVCGVLPKGDF